MSSPAALHSMGTPKWGTNPLIIDIAHATLCHATNQKHIYVDPYSEDEFNEHVAAYRILTGVKGRDGFVDRWLELDICPRADHLLTGLWRPVAPSGLQVSPALCRWFVSDDASSIGVKPTAFVNAPGDPSGDNIKNAYSLLELYWRLGWLPGGAFWVGFTLNQLQTLQNARTEGEFQSPLSSRFMRCIPSRRIPYTAHSSTPEIKINKKGVEVERDDAPSHPSWFMLMPAYDQVIAAEQIRLFDSMASQLGEVF